MATLLQLALFTLLILAAQSNVIEPDTIEQELFLYQHQIYTLQKKIKSECPDLIRVKHELYHDNFTSLNLELAKTTLNQLEVILRSCSDVHKSHAVMTSSSPAPDFQEHYERGATTSGIYLIDPPTGSKTPFSVWCDFFHGHGWTVIQKRFDGSVDFFRDWLSYKKGFGNITGEYWLGLDKIHALTQTNRRLKILVKAADGTLQSGTWSSFLIGSEGDNYKLSVRLDKIHALTQTNRRLNILVKAANETIQSGTWSSFIIGSEGDNYKLNVSSVAYNGSLPEPGLSYSNGMSFPTKDRDHDGSSGDNCAKGHHGAWWYKHCMLSNLNGSYDKTDNSGIWWYGLYHLKETVMRVSRD
ncbi:ficolin-2-like [Watersipora subatra]|uniref:ficolin-2-like n=1 Tax=Watersipora subatra TaxID=2589382 RepID=UPI00355B093B